MRIRSSARSRPLFLGVAAVAYAWWATGLRPFSLLATVAVVGAGVIAMVVASRYLRPRGRVPVALREVLPWIVLFGALATVQLLAYSGSPRTEYPTLSYLANAALDTHVARASAFVAWLTGAGWLARR